MHVNFSCTLVLYIETIQKQMWQAMREREREREGGGGGKHVAFVWIQVVLIMWDVKQPETCCVVIVVHKSRVPDQNGVSLLYIMLEIHHSGREPLKCRFLICLYLRCWVDDGRRNTRWYLLFIFHLGFALPLQDVALHQCLPLSSIAFLFQVVPSFLAMFSYHLLLGHPLDLFPLLGCHTVQCLVHLLSFNLAICLAPFHFCFSVYSVMSVTFVLVFFPIALRVVLFVCQLFIERQCLVAIGHVW